MSPRHVSRFSLLISAISGAAALSIMVAWAFWLLPSRPTLIMMLFTLSALVSVASCGVWAVTACQMRVHRAFRAGVEVGLSLDPDARVPSPRRRPVLELVE